MIQLWRQFGWVVPILALVTAALVMAVFVWKNQKGKAGARWADLIPVLFTLISIGGIFLITLSPLVPGVALEGNTNFRPFDNLRLNLIYRTHLHIPIRNLLANIVLFLPFGFFYSWWIRKRRWILVKTTIAGSVLSIFVEVNQFLLPLGRSTDIDDWMMNTSGAFIGSLLFLLFLKVCRLYVNRKDIKS
ncbi:VanZ family protein [Rossellomorea vietnamensis]|uniref:VanZ family protein n=1 Tax=Rossellomorea vietnamensis TaxID=218284 RepID=A0A5D4MH03_9BACI|nr:MULTISPECIES: VanZ family protein [Bacillaceae]TYS00291.1 VanZ family protein [Rossellomorea vietnamensis]